MIKWLLSIIVYLITVLVVCNALLSWFPRVRWHPFGRLIYAVTEPILAPFRRLLGPVRVGNVGIDLSPLLLLLVVNILLLILLSLLSAVGIK